MSDDRPATALWDALRESSRHADDPRDREAGVASRDGYRELLDTLEATPCRLACDALPKIPTCRRCAALAAARARLLEALNDE